MVPEHKSVMFCREIGRAVIYKLGQRLRSPHVGCLSSLCRDFQLLPVRQVDDTVVLIGNVAGPSLAAAGIDKQIILIVIQARRDHLIKVICRGAVVALQIRAYDVDHDRVIFIRQLGNVMGRIERGRLYIDIYAFLALCGAAVIGGLLPHDHQFRFFISGRFLCRCRFRTCPCRGALRALRSG